MEQDKLVIVEGEALQLRVEFAELAELRQVVAEAKQFEERCLEVIKSEEGMEIDSGDENKED